jgi:uncharacterized protein YndB with AHSA1/START domain
VNRYKGKFHVLQHGGINATFFLQVLAQQRPKMFSGPGGSGALTFQGLLLVSINIMNNFRQTSTMRKLLSVLAALIILVLITLGVFYFISGGPSTIVSHVTINKPRHLVFEYISDMRNELKWNPDVLYMKKTTDGPVGLGTHFRAKWHMSDTIDEQITRFQPSEGVTFENGGPLAVTLQVQLTPIDSATELEARFIATPHGFLRAIFPIMRAKLKQQEQENMVNLKKALEAAR